MASAQKEEKQGSQNSASTQGSGGSKTLNILSFVNLLVTFAILGISFLSFQKEKQKQSIDNISTENEKETDKKNGETAEHGAKSESLEKENKSKQDAGKMVDLGQFTVNLSTVGSVNPKFARVNISVEVLNEDVENQLKARLPQVQNTIIDLFNSKKPSDLSGVDGREYLKEDIKNSLNQFLNGNIMGVYFTSFAVAG